MDISMTIHHHIIPALVLSTFSFTALADNTTTPTPYNDDYITISGFLGSRISEDINLTEGGYAELSSELTEAIAIGWKYDRTSEGELLFSNSKQSLSLKNVDDAGMDVYVQYLHFGGKILFKDNSAFSTSIGLGIGATAFNPSGSQYSTEYVFSGNLTGGMRYQLNEKFALRGDLRVYGSLLNSESNLFCGNNQCLLTVDGEVYVQTELMAGIEYKF